MLPIVLIHGYSAEGKNRTVEDIYGDLPQHLVAEFGSGSVIDIDVSRWISLDDGIGLDDVSFALERARTSRKYRKRLSRGFHAVVHSAGALVIRNWLRLYSPKPSPLGNLVYLAGASFGSGLAHIGQGQLARWGREIAQDTGRGLRVLDELELGAGKTLDMHIGFLEPGNDVFEDFEVQEFCLIGSQCRAALRAVPIRYVKEDSSDGIVRTPAGNLNFNHIRVMPGPEAESLSGPEVRLLLESLGRSEHADQGYYRCDAAGLVARRRQIPFALLYETTHSGNSQGIVDGSNSRSTVLPPVALALRTPYDEKAYSTVAEAFQEITLQTELRIRDRRPRITLWNLHAQYEAHAQLVFRLRDQFGNEIENFDINIRSAKGSSRHRLEQMIEHRHINRSNRGTITFYLRTRRLNRRRRIWQDLLTNCRPARIEITADETASNEITFVPLTLSLSSSAIPKLVQNYRTTVVDVTLLRLPAERVFEWRNAI